MYTTWTHNHRDKCTREQEQFDRPTQGSVAREPVHAHDGRDA